MKCVLVALAMQAAVAVEVDVPGLGSLNGEEGLDVAFFGGIPYAKPPIGSLRWQPPVSHGAWKSPRRAGWLNMGHQCLQPGGTGDEDCLYLNINTPKAALRNNMSLPAMVWIHGGSYVTGSGNIYAPFANEMVNGLKNKVVVITVNYRLNVFGFLASQDIKQRSSDNSAGNFGIQDQRLAMQWVKDHIGAFGANGNAVTIFGESAGGNSVFNHLAQPASFNLYRSAIIESGAYNTGAKTLASATLDYDGLRSATSCTDLDCLLNFNASALEKITETSQSYNSLAHSYGWGPVIDDVSLTASPADLIQAGKHNKKATVIIGSNRDEDASPWFTGGQLASDLDEAGFDKFYSEEQVKADIIQAKAVYDPSNYTYPKNLGNYSRWWWTATRMATDQVPGLGPCGVRWLARNLVQGGSTVHAYVFARACQSIGLGIIPGCNIGSVISPHGGEIPYVFGDSLLTLRPQDRALAREVSAYWGQFASTGAFDSHDWPKYEKDSDIVKRFDVASSGGIVTQNNLRQAACDLWEANSDLTVAPSSILV